MARRDVLGRLIDDDDMGRLISNRQRAPSGKVPDVKTRLTCPPVPSTRLACPCICLAPSPRLACPCICPRRASRAPAPAARPCRASRAPTYAGPCICYRYACRHLFGALACPRCAARAPASARVVSDVLTVAGGLTGPADPRRLWRRESEIGCRLPRLQCGYAHRHRQCARLGESFLECARLAEVEHRSAGVAALSTDGSGGANWSGTHRVVVRVC